MMFATFIWEAVEKEIGRARKPETVVASMKRLKHVLAEGQQGSSLFEVITEDVVEGLKTKVQTEKPACWNDQVEKAIDEILADLRATAKETANSSQDAAPSSTAILELVKGAQCRESPLQRLRDRQTIFRIIYEFVAKVPFSRRWQIGRRLGEGGHSTVRRCTHTYRYPGKVMALKQIHQGRATEFEIEMLRRESEIIKKLFHPHVPVLYDYVEEKRECFLVIPLYEGGDMLERIVEKSGNHFTEQTCRHLLQDLLETLGYLHSVGVAHRDIKPENVVFADRGERAGMFLIDFGFAASGVEGASLTTPCGTPQYAAPEILNAMPHGCKVDMWSLGVVAYVMMCGFPPFYHDEEPEMFRLVKRGEFDFPSPSWDQISDKAKDFIRKLLTVDQEQRFSAAQALRHPWIVDEAKEEPHLGLVHSEALKFRARSQWAMAINQACEDAPESFTLKNMRLQQAEDATAAPAAAVQPEEASVALNEQEQEEMRRTMVDAADAGIESVVQSYTEFQAAQPSSPSTPPTPSASTSGGSGATASDSELAQEVARLKKIVNKQRCEISNLEIQLDECKTQLMEYQKAELAHELAQSASIVPPPLAAGMQPTSSKRVGFSAKQEAAVAASSAPEPPPDAKKAPASSGDASSNGGSGVSSVSSVDASEDDPVTATANDASPTPQDNPAKVNRMKSWGSALMRRSKRGISSVFTSNNGGDPSPSSNRRLQHRSSIMRLNLDADDAEFFTLHQLQSGEVEANIDPTRRELYLSDEVFFDNFKMSKDAFLSQPKWKQVNQKKQLRLF